LTRITPLFSVGDIIFDIINKDIGVLLRRYNLFDGGYYDIDPESLSIVMVWDIYWTGPDMWPGNDRLQTYTEEGLEILFDSGVLVHYKNI
jgi:hypothetical protein